MKNSQQSLQPLLNSFRLLVVRDPVAETITFVTFIPHSNDRHRGAVQNVAVRPQPRRHAFRCMSCNSTVVVRHIGKSMVPCHRHPAFACSATPPDHRSQAHRKVDGSMPSESTPLHVLQLGCVVRHIGKSMVTFHLHSARCIFFTRPDHCGQAHREVDGSMPSATTSLHVLQLGLTAWSGTSERQWLHAIGIHNVALLATRPSWSGTSESRWSHAIDIHTVAVACPHASATRPDRRGQAHRKVDGSMPSAYTSLHVLQLGLTVGVRHIGKSMDLCYGIYIVACSATRPDRRGQAHGKPMVPRHRHPHRCLSCTKGV